MKNLQKDVRIMLSTFRELSKLLPKNKQHKANQSISDIVKNQNMDNEDSVKKIIDQLNFKMNFYKLAYPDIFIKQQQQQSESIQDNQDSIDVYWEKIIESKLVDETENDQNGKYILKEGKLIKGEAQKKIIAEHSNWFAGNVDPEDLQKQKELLDRMHYKGAFWEGKQKPKSVMEEDPRTFIKGEAESNPYYNNNSKNEGKKNFEKVQR